MKIDSKNIVSSFFKRAIFAIVFISIISSIAIYYFQQYNFYTALADDIKISVDKKLNKYDKKLHLSNKEFLEEDVKSFMKKLEFIIIEIYDNQKKEIFTVTTPGEKFEAGLKLIQEHDDLIMHEFPKSKKMSYNFFELSNKHYFLQIFYPIYKSNKLLGYVEGISYVEPIVVQRFKSGIIAVIITVISTIVIFSFLIFPLIYFAYKKLNTHRLELLSSNITMINTLGNAIALRDSDTNEHNYRVTLYAIKFAQVIGLDNLSIQKLIKGAFLHDVGKIGISDNILLKNGKLDEQEFKVMKSHVIKGVELVHENKWLDDAKEVILYHHEKYDGSGYPNNVKGNDIPKVARIFAIVDVFDALTSKRPYKEKYTYEDSITILQEGCNNHFDGELLDIFIEISNNIYLDTKFKSKDELKEELDSLIKKYF